MASVIQQRIPPLEDGDRLSREEFERRYDGMPGLKKAELIEGIVYMPSPVRLDQHGMPHFELIGWLGFDRWATPSVVGADNTRIRLDLENMPQPDACMFIAPAKGGQARISDDDDLEDAPELVDEAGLYRSRVFPGLWLDPAALIRGDTAALQGALQRGLTSREHAEFVAKWNAQPWPDSIESSGSPG